MDTIHENEMKTTDKNSKHKYLPSKVVSQLKTNSSMGIVKLNSY